MNSSCLAVGVFREILTKIINSINVYKYVFIYLLCINIPMVGPGVAHQDSRLLLIEAPAAAT